MDRDLESKLAKELSGIFNWAIDFLNLSCFQKPIFRIATNSIYSEVLDQETGFGYMKENFSLSPTYT
jgi:hypothetical protein